jgi:hypothetical protein
VLRELGARFDGYSAKLARASRITGRDRPVVDSRERQLPGTTMCAKLIPLPVRPLRYFVLVGAMTLDALRSFARAASRMFRIE